MNNALRWNRRIGGYNRSYNDTLRIFLWLMFVQPFSTLFFINAFFHARLTPPLQVISLRRLSSALGANYRGGSGRQQQNGLNLAPQQLGAFESLESNSRRKVESKFYGIFNDDSLIPFQDAWKIQQDLQQQHFDRMSLSLDNQSKRTEKLQKTNGLNTIESETNKYLDTILFVQHEPVFTFGTASDHEFLLNAKTEIPVFDISRGGEITYHGPGQLVVYPILNLRHYQPDLHWYIRALEEAAIRAISSKLHDDTAKNAASQHPLQKSSNFMIPSRYDDITGVWLDSYKVAAIGVHARRWVTQHGLAVNVEDRCLKPFEEIVPCGLKGRKVGCLNQFLTEPTTVADFVPYMVKAMEDVFHMDI